MATLKAEISKQYKKITGEDVTIVLIWDEEGYMLHGKQELWNVVDSETSIMCSDNASTTVMTS